MTKAQKVTLAWTSFAVISLAAAAVIYTTSLAIRGRLVGDEPVGELFLELSANFSSLGIMLKMFCAVILTGIGVLGAVYRSKTSVALMCLVLVASVLCCVALLISVSKPEVAADLWGPSRTPGTQSYEELQSVARPMIIWIGGALSTVLAAILGISTAKGISRA
jgi:hypothetical protein